MKYSTKLTLCEILYKTHTLQITLQTHTLRNILQNSHSAKYSIKLTLCEVFDVVCVGVRVPPLALAPSVQPVPLQPAREIRDGGLGGD